MDYFDDKKPIFVFGFFLNALITIVMGIIIYGKDLLLADRFVDFCQVVFIINIIINAGYILFILLFSIRKIVDWINMVLDRGVNKQIKQKVDKKLNFLDIIKDPAVIFSVLFLIFVVLTFIFYFIEKPWYYTTISFILAIFTGIFFLVRARGEMIMAFKIFLVFLGIFLVVFIFTIIWNNITWY